MNRSKGRDAVPVGAARHIGAEHVLPRDGVVVAHVLGGLGDVAHANRVEHLKGRKGEPNLHNGPG